MATQNGSNKAPFLWTIIPVAALLTLLYVKVNHNTVQPHEQLAGDRPQAKVENVTAPHAAGDTLHHEAAADTSHAAPAAHEGAAHETGAHH